MDERARKCQIKKIKKISYAHLLRHWRQAVWMAVGRTTLSVCLCGALPSSTDSIHTATARNQLKLAPASQGTVCAGNLSLSLLATVYPEVCVSKRYASGYTVLLLSLSLSLSLFSLSLSLSVDVPSQMKCNGVLNFGEICRAGRAGRVLGLNEREVRMKCNGVLA